MVLSASGAVAADSTLQEAIQDACDVSFISCLEFIFKPHYDDDMFKYFLDVAWLKADDALSGAKNTKLNARLRNKSEFKAYVTPGSKEEKELITLLRSMANKEVPWSMLVAREWRFSNPIQRKYLNRPQLVVCSELKLFHTSLVSMDSFVKSTMFSKFGVDSDSDSVVTAEISAEPRKKKRKVTPKPVVASPEPAKDADIMPYQTILDRSTHSR